MARARVRERVVRPVAHDPARLAAGGDGQAGARTGARLEAPVCVRCGADTGAVLPRGEVVAGGPGDGLDAGALRRRGRDGRAADPAGERRSALYALGVCLGVGEKVADDLEVAVRLLERGRVRAVLEHDLTRAADTVDEGCGDRIGAHVVAAAHDEGGDVQLVQPVAYIPAFERAGHRPLVRALHSAVDVGRPAGGHALELFAGLRTAIEVAVEVDVHR